MRFPLFTRNLKPRRLVKVKSSNGIVMVSNDQALEYAYNQFLEGANGIKIMTPDGKWTKRAFRKRDPSNKARLELHDPKKDPPPRGLLEENQMKPPPEITRIEGK